MSTLFPTYKLFTTSVAAVLFFFLISCTPKIILIGDKLKNQGPLGYAAFYASNKKLLEANPLSEQRIVCYEPILKVRILREELNKPGYMKEVSQFEDCPTTEPSIVITALPPGTHKFLYIQPGQETLVRGGEIAVQVKTGFITPVKIEWTSFQIDEKDDPTRSGYYIREKTASIEVATESPIKASAKIEEQMDTLLGSEHCDQLNPIFGCLR